LGCSDAAIKEQKGNIKYENQNIPQRGFTLVEIMIVWPSSACWRRSPSPTSSGAHHFAGECVHQHLRQIDGAIQQWALENSAAAATAVTAANITPYLGRGAVGSLGNVYCPSDTAKAFASSYTIVDVQTKRFARSSGHARDQLSWLIQSVSLQRPGLVPGPLCFSPKER